MLESNDLFKQKYRPAPPTCREFKPDAGKGCAIYLLILITALLIAAAATFIKQA